MSLQQINYRDTPVFRDTLPISPWHTGVSRHTGWETLK